VARCALNCLSEACFMNHHCQKYVSGRFSTAYHSTIGIDLITKTLPHHSKPDESVTLQIWVSHHHYHYVYFLFYCHRSHNRRILPDKNAFHPFLLHFSVERIPSSSSLTSISPRRCALSAVGGRSFAHADLLAKRK